MRLCRHLRGMPSGVEEAFDLRTKWREAAVWRQSGPGGGNSKYTLTGRGLVCLRNRKAASLTRTVQAKD